MLICSFTFDIESDKQVTEGLKLICKELKTNKSVWWRGGRVAATRRQNPERLEERQAGHKNISTIYLIHFTTVLQV